MEQSILDIVTTIYVCVPMGMNLLLKTFPPTVSF